MIDLEHKLVFKENYENKQDFIKDFVCACRLTKNHPNTDDLKHKTFVTVIEGEIWQFNIFSKDNHIETSCALVIPNKRWIHYPITQWDGEYYSRWDNELRAFLNREICKR